jgi:flagellar hook-associated protein 3 FlgL
MSVSSINYGSSLLGQSVQNINNQLTDLSTQLSSGVKSTNYAGMGVNEGFAIAARTQLSNISAFGDTITNVNTIINAANAALQSLSDTTSQVQSAASATPQNLTGSGQTIGQQNALSEMTSIVGILNTQVGDRYIFSGNAIGTPAVASADDILNGTATQAGLKQVIAERQQADLGSNGLGRLVISSPTATSVNVAEDAAGSPFGLKLSSVTSSLTNATVTGPSGSPAAVSVDMTAGNPNPGDQITYSFNLPDGTSESIQLTASNSTPLPSGSFAIGATPAATATNLNAALTSAIGTLAGTSLVAASAVAAGDNFFNTDGTATGSAVNNQAAPPAAVTGATALSGAVGTNSLSASFAPGDTLTVNGTTLTFVASGATGNQINVTDSVQTLLSKIDAITSTSTPSTVHGGAISINTDNASSLSITSSNAAAFAALGFSGTVTAPTPPLRVSGSPLGSATSLVNGSANTVAWYTGNSGPGSARSTSTVRVDSSQTVQFGAQANEQAIRQALQNISVYAAVTVSPTGTNSAGVASALSERVAANLTPQANQQTIQDMQTDFATAQNTMKDVQARQTQTQTALQNMVSDTEGISQDQVASEILALQNSLQASYQTTAMLSQLSLVKFLPLA